MPTKWRRKRDYIVPKHGEHHIVFDYKLMTPYTITLDKDSESVVIDLGHTKHKIMLRRLLYYLDVDKELLNDIIRYIGRKRRFDNNKEGKRVQ